MDVHEVAAGAVKIAETKMAELIRQMTLQRGLDPREFVIFAYGGAGPAYGCQYARELGIDRVVVPLGKISSTWSAFGTLCADILHVYEKSELLSQPFDSAKINDIFSELEAKARKQLEDDGVRPGQMKFHRFVEMKYKMQIHQLPVPVPSGELTERDLEKVSIRFEEIYESFYGKGSAYREAGIEIGLFKVNAVGEMIKPQVPSLEPMEENASEGTREIFWGERGEFVETPIYAGPKLGQGDVIYGPAVAEYPETTVVVHPYAKGIIDSSGNFIMELEGE
jgi:N-methylhydantoinase A